MSDLEHVEKSDAPDSPAEKGEGAPVMEADAEAVPEPATETETEAEAVPEPEPDAESDAAPKTVPGTDPTPEAAIAPAPEPEPDDADATAAATTAELPSHAERDNSLTTNLRPGETGRTERRPVVETPNDDEPRRPGADDARPGKLRVLADIVSRHRAATAALALIAVAAVTLLCVALSHAFAVPDGTVVAEDARSLLTAPAYSSGTFGVDTTLVTQEVDVRSVSRSQSAPEGVSPQFGASGYAAADVVVSYAGQSVRADRGATLAYALVDGSWSLLPGTANEGITWHATSGVDQQKVLRNVHLLLERLDDQAGEKDQSLADLYADASVTLESETFNEDEQTDTLEITCTKSEPFSSYTCLLTVVFSFGQTDGQWEVSQVSASEGAYDRNLEALVGTWQGTFQSQETSGGKCLSGRSGGLSVTIGSASAADGSATVTGTVSGVAHYHANPGSDTESSGGDSTFADVPFTASLVDDEGGRLVFTADLPEDVGGTVSLELRFGTEEDPGRAEALVTTKFPHTEMILIFPHEVTATYEDTFTLVKMG